jgi:beta-mannosidase
MNRSARAAALLFLLLQSSCTHSSAVSVMDLKEGWHFRQVPDGAWRRAAVPGCVHTDLFARGLIPDPFYADNEKNLQWIENEDWEYRLTFDADAALLARERIELDFEGLDTYADVFLNDSLLLRVDNMFREWRVGCNGVLRQGANELRVLFHSPERTVRERWATLDRELPGGSRVLTRKAAYHYGWDFGPRFVTSGIWRPVRLVSWDAAKIEDLWIVQRKVTAESSDLRARFEIESTRRQAVTLSIRADDEELGSIDVDLVPGLNRASLDFSIPKPKLWWTNGLGKPFLYKVFGEAKVGSTLLDSVARRFGVRTVELVREKDEAGASFYFRLNGAPVFMKGANYVPQDVFLPRVGRDRYEFLIVSAAKAGMNMLRVWGGGVYENDAFYDLCDENGILVWQDFMFACAMYPGDSAFLGSVKEEAVENVKRLRNHPCIALWCGNNESDEGWHRWGWQRQYGYTPADSARIREDYVKLFHELLPAVVEEHGGAAYWPSSPAYGRADPRSLTEGDSHYWGVWHDGEPFEAFARKVPRFMSEFGFQSFPALAALENVARPEDMRIDSGAMLAHQKNDMGNEIIQAYMALYYRRPRDFESFVYVSQLLQAEGMKAGIEAHRRAKPYCMGSLFWQLDDCWPAVSWSSIDCYGNPKALYYYARKAFRDVLVSPVLQGDKVRVLVVSDRMAPIEATVALKLLDFQGRVFWETGKPLKIPANSSTCVFEDDFDRLLEGKAKQSIVLCAEVSEKGELLSENLLYFVAPKDLELPSVRFKPAFDKSPSISISSAMKVANGYSISLSAGALVKNVFLSIEGCKGFFDDNYFDMLPGSRVTVRFFTEERIEDLEGKIKIRSLADTY